MKRLSYQPLEYIPIYKPVNRLHYISNACRGKRVLDLGCWDETALSKKDLPFWLHSRIAGVASNTIGIDSSASLPVEGFSLPNSKIYRGDVTDKASIPGKDIDIMVGGELIEHLPNTLQFFEMLKDAYPGKRLICTTPNATNFTNFVLGIFRRESTHHDHLSIYSYKTLSTLANRANFSQFELYPYYVKYSEMTLRNKGVGRFLVQLAEKSVNIGEYLIPLFAGGYILDAVI